METKSRLTKENIWRAFVTIALVSLWVVVILISNDADKAHGRMRHDYNALRAVQKANRLGKRNTYCDMLKHMVSEHNWPASLTDECKYSPVTDLDVILRGKKK